MTTKGETQDVVIIWLFSEFPFYLIFFCMLKNWISAFYFFLIAILIFFISDDKKIT